MQLFINFLEKKSGINDLLMIGVGVLPAVLVGLFFGSFIENSRSMNLVTFNYLIMGLILYLIKNKKNSSNDISYKTAIIIGLVQSLALLPGISRSGITIASAILLGVKKDEAVKFSFVMSIPLIFGATLYKFGDIAVLVSDSIGIIFFGFVVSSIVGYFAIVWMMKIVELNTFWKFSIYCWLVVIILLFSAS
tara:strand:+ start:51 stop:626 length:576 start_codon:yes stop_codon:yes gene_type:complete